MKFSTLGKLFPSTSNMSYREIHYELIFRTILLLRFRRPARPINEKLRNPPFTRAAPSVGFFKESSSL